VAVECLLILIKYARDHWPLETSRPGAVGSSVSQGISTFSFCSALNELYFAVWVSSVVQSSDCTNPKFSPSRPDSITWLAGRHRHLLSLLKAEPFEDVSYNKAKSSGTSGTQLKLMDYISTISAFPTRQKPSCAFMTLELDSRDLLPRSPSECSFCTDMN